MHSRSVRSVVAAFLVSVASLAHAQSPEQQHLVQAGNLAYLGKFTLPTVDPNGTSLTYGGNALGIGADGTSLYYGCIYGNSVARVRIPTIGGVASIVEPCQSPANLNLVNPTDPNAKLLGGVLSWKGRVVVTGYAYYDGSGSATKSHFIGSDVTTSAGPYTVGTEKAGLVAGYMGLIPQEWRALLGGPALTGQCCIPIISRSSYGPSVSVFNPDDLGVTSPSPSKMLVGYPDAHQTLGAWDTANPYFSGTTKMGGVAFPPGSRSVLFVGRHGSTYCYGKGTNNQSLHGQPTPDGTIYCYDPTDESKGNHGYPYRHMVWAYDANDLLAVRQGTKQPWDVKPYTTWTLPEMGKGNGVAFAYGATFDPATRRWYITTQSDGGAPSVHVYEITSAVIEPPPPPTDEICGDNIDNDNDGLVDEGCSGGSPEVCGDLIDNDLDGLIDEGCAQEKVEICGDKVDNDGDGQVDEGCATTEAVPAAPRRLYGSVKRSTVSFKWYPPLTGGAVEDYVLEAGLSPGTTFFAGSVGLNTTLSVPDVGIGRYYVRVRARNRNGQGPPSNEVTVSVGCNSRPRRLSGLAATSREGLVTINWTDPDGCSGTTYELTVGTRAAGGLQTISTEDLAATTLLPAGQYVARVTAQSETGTSDPADLEFTVSGGTCARPSFRTSLRSVVAGRRVGLFWSPLDPDTAAADDRVAPVAYVIEAGTVAGASDIGVLPMARASQFIADVPPGVYFARVRPANPCGGGRASNEVKLVVR